MNNCESIVDENAKEKLNSSFLPHQIKLLFSVMIFKIFRCWQTLQLSKDQSITIDPKMKKSTNDEKWQRIIIRLANLSKRCSGT
jgi:hypothetical protein